MTEAVLELYGHSRRVGLIEWHPTSSGILFSAGYDYKVYWDTMQYILAHIEKESQIWLSVYEDVHQNESRPLSFVLTDLFSWFRENLNFSQSIPLTIHINWLIEFLQNFIKVKLCPRSYLLTLNVILHHSSLTDPDLEPGDWWAGEDDRLPHRCDTLHVFQHWWKPVGHQL